MLRPHVDAVTFEEYGQVFKKIPVLCVSEENGAGGGPPRWSSRFDKVLL